MKQITNCLLGLGLLIISLHQSFAQNTLNLAGLSASSTSTVAYSLRRLSTGYTGNLIEVRRSSDNTTTNIGYDGSGNLDVAALTAFVGAGDGFIRTWYDQSGNANNGVQSSNSLQPQIVSSGTVLLSNSRPVIRCNGTTYIDGGTSSYGITGAHTLNAIYNFQSGTVQHIIDRVLTGGGNPLTSITGSNQGQYRNDAGTLQTVGSTQSPPFSNIFTATWDASNNINHYKNGVVDYTGTLSLPATLDIMRIGMHFSITGTAVLNFWEVIMFPSAISTSERMALEANQFVYYNFVPSITAVTPLAGDAGTAVSVTGTNFNATSSNNIVYFGATKATVSSATTTSLNVTVPVGSTFSPVTVQNTNYGFAAFSQYAHMQTYNNAAFVSGKVNFDPKVDITAGNAAQGLVFADIDGDGKADMIAVNSASNNAYVYRNISSSGSLTTGSFAAPVTLTTAAGPLYAAVADIDGDGKRDIIVSNSSANSISVFRNTSTSGSISLSAKVDFTTATAPNIVATGDIDGDGRPDVTVGNGSSSVVSVFRNTSVSGTISLAAKVDFSLGGNTRMAALRDIDGDGKQDMIAACNSCAVISIFRNIATPGSISSGSFATKVDFTTGTSPREIAVSDIDGDGKPDVVVTNTGSNSISVFRNLATSGSITTGSLAAKTDFTTANAPRGLDIGDIDGDGKPDVAVACGSGNSITVFRNTATSGTINSGSFAARVDFPAMASGSPDDIAVGDLDGDGRADVAVANSTFSATVSVFRNNPLQPVTGTLTVCAGSTTTLSSGTGNGVWSSSNTGIATVGSASGVVTGVSGGTVTITYAGSAGTSFTGNYITTTVTVNSVSGGSNVGICPAGSTNLTASGSSTYTWTPATGLSATTGSSVTATPTITTTYSVTGTGTGCTNTATVTVSINPLPSSTFTVTPNPVCVNNTATFVSSLSPCSGNALTFNGSTSSASKGSVVTTAVNNITIEAWVNWSGTVANYSFVFLNGNSALDGYALVIPPSSNQLQILIGNIGFLSSSATLTSGWHHVAIVRNAGTWSLYLDGTQYSVTSSSTAPNTPTTDFKVGNSQVGTEAFNGSIDDVAFWNVARSTGQIQSDMQSCNINTQANLLGYWKFNEGSGATTADASGNGGTLSLSSTSWVVSPSLSTYAWSFGDGSTSTANNVSHTYTAAATYTPTFTVTDANGCTSSATQSVTVNAFPVVAAITGNTTLSTTITTTLASTTGGGVWTSAATGIATIGSSTGVVTGVSAGTALISYTVTTSGCSTTVTTNVTVNTPVNGLAFDGTNDYVVLPTGLTATYTDFTYEAWVYPTSNTAWQRIMDFGSGATVNMFITSSYNGAGIPRFAITTGGTAGEQQLTSSTAMPLNTWSHIAVTINGATNTGTLYLNGNVVATNAGMTLDPSSLGSLSNNWLGRSQYPDPYFIGRQDEVRIWNIARSQAQIRADMNCDVAQQANLVAYYRFNQGTASGTNTGLTGAFDYSGNSKCGTLTNFALTGSSSNYVTGAVGSCNAISDVTPGSFSGNTPVCVGSTITLSNANAGGTWSTASGNITLNSTSGLVTGVTAGTATVNYTLSCNTSSVVVTINALPVVAAITGNTTLSTTIRTTLADATAGGVWTSAATGVATIGSSTGVVTGVSAGTALISYTVTTSGCSTTVTTNVTVNTPQNGLNFDGSSDYVSLSGSTGIPSGNGQYTIEAWIKPTAGGVYGIAGWGNYGTNNQVTAFRLHNSTTLHHYWWFNDLSATVPNLVDGNWHHVACTYNGTTRAIYCDGALVASDVPSGHNVTVTNNVNIGRTNNIEYFPGGMDEVRIWNVGRSQSQIQANMNCDVSQQAGLVAYYRFNQGTASGTNTGLTGAFDYSGNNNCGTLNSFALSGSTSNYVTGAVGTCNVIADATPGSFSGNTPVCVGSTITLSNANTGGTWSTASGNITLNSTSGLVTGVTAGTATVNYTLRCNTSSVVVTINALPVVAAITGNTTLSTTIRTTLADATAGGVWTSAATGVATIGSSTGVVTGVSAGTALISYTVTTSGCSTTVTTNVTVKTPGNGLNFDGSTDFVSVPNSSQVNISGNITIEAWIYPTSTTPGVQNVVCKSSNVQNTGYIFPRTDNGWTNMVAYLHIGGTWRTFTVPTPGINAWHHCALTYDGASVKTYIDGVLVGNTAQTGAIATNSNILAIGTQPGYSEFFNGSADEVRIWNVARTQSQIQADMNCDVAQQANLVAYYRFNQGTASGTNTALTSAFDYSGNNNCGTLNNFALTGSSSNYVAGAVGTCNVIADATPGSFSGNAPVCVGSTITLSNANTGGTWSTASGNITLNSTSGLVTGVTAGTATVSYTLNCNSSSVIVTINAVPTVAAITGTTTLTVYNTTTLANATPSGVWASSATGTATVNSTSGVVSGVAEGTARISYTVTNGSGCSTTVTTNVTVSGYNALGFDGLNDYVNIGTQTLNSYTKEAWIYPTGSGNNNIISGGVTSTDNALWAPSRVLSAGHNGSWTQVQDPATLSLNTWYHVAVTYDAPTTTMRLYKNGVLVSSNSSVPAISTPTGVLLIGAFTAGGNLFQGKIDEVRIWNRALCQSEIANNMTGRLPGGQTGLINYYTFDQGIGGGTNTGLTTLIDYSGAGNNGTLNNSALTGGTSNWVTGTVNALAASFTPPTITASSNVTICNGASTTLTVSGGTAYRWTPSTGLSVTTGSSVTASPSSTITYTVTDECGGTATVQVSVNPTPTTNGGSGTAICIGSSTSLTASGAATYTWAPSASLSASTGVSVTATPTVTTIYTVTGTNGVGCSSNATVTVTVNPYSAIYSVTGGGPYCAGTAGSTIGLSGSDAGFNYQLYKGASTSGSPVAGTGSAISFGPRTLSGSYTVVAVGVAAPGCTNSMTGSTSVSILTSPAPVAVLGGGSVCGGGPGVNIYLGGSAVGIDYQLYLGATPVGSPVVGVGTSLSFGLFTTLGTYTVIATNPVNGCFSNMTGSAVITAASGITAYAMTGGGSYCTGGSGVNIGLAGSSSGLSYQLFLGTTAMGSAVAGTGSAISFGLQTFAGTYTVVATNTTTGCFGNMTGSVTVSIDPLPNIYTVTGGGSYCAGGAGLPVGLSLSQTGVDYQLYNGASPSGSPVPGTGSAISFGAQTAAGTYTIVATDGTTTCTNTMGGSVTVSVNALPTVTTGAGAVICAGSPAGLTAGGAVDYSWSPATALTATTGSSVTANPTTTTTYTVTGTDANGCVNTAAVTVTVNTLPTVSGGAGVAICNGSSTGLTASGALTYIWSPAAALSATTGASVTANPSTTTIYSVTGTDGNGCENTAAVTVTVNAIPTVSAGSGVAICTGLNTTLTASGGTTYTWAPATALSATTGVSVTASPTVATTYTVTGTTAGCNGTASVTVAVNPLPAYSAGANVAVCSGNSTSLTATEPIGGRSIQLPGSGANYISIPSTASLKLMTSNFTVSTWIYVTSTSQQNILFHGLGCSTWASWFLGIGGSEINDYPGKIVFGYRTGNGSGMNQVASPSNVSTNTWVHVTGTYDGSNLRLYLDGALAATVAASGTPWNSTDNLYIGQDPGCGGRNIMNGRIDDLQLWNITRSASDIATYYNQHVAAATAGIIGSWAFDEVSGATVIDSSSIADNGTIVGSLTRITSGTAPIYSASSSTYSWAPAATLSASTGATVVASPTITTTYTVTGTNANGCINTATVTVSVNSLPAISGGSGVAICAGTSTGLTASGGVSYTWAPSTGLSATTGTSVTATPAATTTYTVTGTGSNGCVNTATVTVTVNSLPSVTVGSGVTMCAGVSTTLTSGGAVTYSWSPATALSASTGVSVTASPTVTTTYTVTGTDAIGCSNTALVTVSVNPTPNDYAVTGGGSFCSSTSGTAIGLAGSDVGVNYQLYTAGLPVGSPVAGTGGAVSFGLHTASGVYTVVATNAVSGCTFNISGSVSLTSYPSPAPVAMIGGGAYCFGGTGVSVGISGSAIGVNYQLYRGGSPVGSPVAGIGMGFNFGLYTTAGTYTVVATNVISGCTTNATGTAVITVYSALSTHTVTGGGNYCSGGSGVAVGLNGSDIGVNYQLYRGGLPLVGTTLAGTGSALSFGTQTTAGVYTVVAIHATNGCTANMAGSATVTIDPLPTVYTVTGGGSYCTGGSGMAVGLSSSDAGTDYQLYLGASPVGSPVSGTGSAISFGTQSTAGIYTVVATNTSTGCVNNMTGSATIAIYILPSVYIVSGGGSYCSGPGLHIYLGGSGGGTNYQLFNGATPVGSPVAGTGSYIDFGAFTTPGTYTVVATNATTSCSISMTGSATITGISLPTAYNVTGSGSYCSGGTGMAVGLSNSDLGINYQLYRGATALGSAVAGTGSAISFGLHTTAGTYTVVATNASLGCTSNMTGSAVIIVNPLPAPVTMTGGGAYCTGGTGVSIGLSGSAVGIDYQLYLGATPVGSAVTGIGTALSFGTHTTAGTYTAVATNTVTACASNMSGSAVVTINPLPTVYSVTGGGSYCSGSTGLAVGLSGSQAGVNYQLYNGASTVGSPVSGTGSAITFGIQTAAGTYTVVATNASTACVNNMTGSATITVNALPIVYTVTGGGPYCVGSSGSAIGLSGSDVGIDYRLYNGTSAVGSPVAGTGSALSFGTYTVATTYTVTATNTVTGCSSNMSGSASITINSLPAPVLVTGGGTICVGGTGVAVGLAASASGISYQLYVDATPAGSPVTGVGGSLSFGLQTAIGTYTAIGTHPVTGCSNNMTGSVIISNYTPPTAFAVTGGGSYCTGGTGVVVGLAGSATGVTYQLYRGATSIGSPVTGTGAALSFGLHTTAGTYTVVGTTTSNGCTGNMTGSAVISLNPLPSVYTVTGGGSYCSGGAGVSVGVSNSDIGTNYQLYNGVNPVGSAVAGTGAAISFGLQTAAGTYTVVATIAATSCTGNMTGSAAISIDPLPTAYTVTGGGSYCSGPGVHVYLSNSTAGVNYQLYRGATPVGGPVAGTGAALDFGGFTALGTYTVVATNATTSCVNNMSGSAVISGFALPTVYTVTGGGGYCSGGTGAVVGLSNSDVSVDYQLYLGATPVGGTVAGTGSAISFGPQATTGTYTVLAINSGSSCTSNMSGSATVSITALPTAYTVTGGGSFCLGGTGVAVGLSSSASGVNYQLYNGVTAMGSPVAGTGSAISFGQQTTVGTYTVVATDGTTTCTNNMTGSATISTITLPTAYTVSGGGSYCAGGIGATISLAGSQTGVNYQLYNGASAVGAAVAGTGSSLSFGLHTTAGTYTVVATNTSTTCSATMSGSVAITTLALPTVYAFTGGGGYCSGGSGVTLGLAGSDVGITYQLFLGSMAVGSAVSGTGSAISFGTHVTGGTYTVLATNTVTGCTASIGSTTITVYPLPAATTVSGGGAYCSGGTGATIWLPGSGVGVNYQLFLGATPVGSPAAGVGTYLGLGTHTTTGTYTVVATNVATGCTNNMTGSATISIHAPLTTYTVTGGGSYCSGGTGVVVGLSGSAAGVEYKAYRDGLPLIGSVSGTGSSISFGLQTMAGTYTVVATNTTTTCTLNMSGSAAVSVDALPTAFTVTGGGSYCTGGTGVAVGLSSSTSGVNYQLYRGTTAVGSPVAGTGSAISFGLQTTAGTYTATATTVASGCFNTMSGSVSVGINSLPPAYTVTGGGSYCAGGSTGPNIYLSACSGLTTYQLYLGATPVGSPVAATGGSINFGSFTTVGTYSVTATSTLTGCTSNMTGSATISTIPLPTVYTVTGGGSYCTGGSGVAIGLSSSNTGISYQLYRGATAIGAAVTGTGSAISFGVHTVAGTYTVVATVAGTFCTSNMSGSAVVVINPLPTIFSVTGGGSYCSGGAGVTIGLSSSVSGTNYQLYRGVTTVGSPVAGTGSAISFGLQTTAGTYTVVATTSATGCVSNMTGSAAVSINTLPTVYTVTGGGSYCTGGTGVLVGLSASQTGTSYQLYLGGSPVGSVAWGTGAAITFGLKTATGTYTVVATNASSCTANMSGSATVSVNPLPTDYTVTGGGSYCSGGTGVAVGLSSSQSGVNYQLYRSTSAVGSPVAGTGSAISFGLQTIAGTYTVKATDASTGCFVTMTGSAAVTISAAPTVCSMTGGGSYCTGGTGVAVGLSASISGVTYQLYLSGSPVGSPVSGTGAGLSFGLQTTAGTYTAVATNGAGCTSNMSGTATVVVNALPTAYTVTGGGSYCSGGTGVNIGLSGSASTAMYRLMMGATPVSSYVYGTGSALNFGKYTAAGTYTVQATTLTTGCVATMSGNATVTINPIPTITGSYYTVAPGSTRTLTGSPTSGVWTSTAPTVATIGSSSGIVTGVALGSTYIYYTVSGCLGYRIFWVTPTGLREAAPDTTTSTAAVFKGGNIYIAPNPTRGMFMIRGSIDASDAVTLDVTNMLGQVIHSSAVTAKDGEINQEVQLPSSLANGMYIVTLRAGGESKVFHLVVEK